MAAITGLPIKPNDAQAMALEALDKSRKENKNKGLVVMATGAGKTILAAMDTLQADARSILFMVHRNEINYQAVDEFRRVRGQHEDIGIINGDSKDFSKPILFATVQTLSKDENLKQLAGRTFDYFIIDECHHVGAPTYKKVMGKVKAKFTLGLTATPERMDEEKVIDAFDQNLVFDFDLKKGIDQKVLTNFIYLGLHDNVDYSDIQWKGHKYKESDLNKKLIIDKRDEQIVREFKEHCGSRQTIGFCVSVKHASIMTDKFRKAGITAIPITHLTPKEQRRQYIQDFRAGKYQVIFTKDIFNEGVDFPSVQALLFLRPTFSKTVFLQQLGRGLRKAEGKKNVLVLDFISNYHNAYMIRKWMPWPTSDGSKEKIPKPEFHYDKPQIWFDSKVIDIFRRMENSAVTNENLIAELHRLRKEFGKVTQEIINKYGKFGSTTYHNHFGSLNNALLVAGLPINHEKNRGTKKEKLAELHRLYKQFENVNYKIVTEHGKFSCGSYKRAFGSLNNALRVAGLPVNRAENHDKKEMIADLKMLHTKFGKVDGNIITEHGKFNRKAYVSYFGSLNNALIIAGLPINRRRTFDKKEMIADLHKLHKQFGKINQKIVNEFGRFSSTSYRKQFGSFNNALRVAGLSINLVINIEEEKLIADLLRLSKKFRKVTNDIIEEHGTFSAGTYHRRFGSLNNALRAAGLPINKPETTTKK